VRNGWRIEERVAPAGELHASWPSVEADPAVRAVARCRPTTTAVVLGSTQPVDTVDGMALASSGWELVRRRSGGGAVLVDPDDPVWIDVWVPTGDPLATTDVTAAFAWLGVAWGTALRGLGLTGVDVQGDGPGACTRWSGQVCFGGVGSGEVTVDGRKVVGLSQRRNRRGSTGPDSCTGSPPACSASWRCPTTSGRRRRPDCGPPPPASPTSPAPRVSRWSRRPNR